jgi:hypothetical protein
MAIISFVAQGVFGGAVLTFPGLPLAGALQNQFVLGPTGASVRWDSDIYGLDIVPGDTVSIYLGDDFWGSSRFLGGSNLGPIFTDPHPDGIVVPAGTEAIVLLSDASDLYFLDPFSITDFGPLTTFLDGTPIVPQAGEGAMAAPLDYIASYSDLRAAFGTDAAMGRSHFLEHGLAEDRSVSFRGLDYIASHPDLIAAFGADRDAGARHYITNGATEGRLTDGFDGARYLANYADLRATFGNDTDAAAAHFITLGHAEGRTDAIWTGA